VFALVIIAAGVFYISQRDKSEEPEVVDVETPTDPNDIDVSMFQTEKVEYDLPIVAIVDGVVEELADVRTIPPTRGQIQFNVDVTFTVREDANYNIIIEEYGGEQLYQVWIPPQYLSAGSIPLNLDGKVFDSGKYRIEVLEEGTDSVSTAIAEGVFEVVE